MCEGDTATEPHREGQRPGQWQQLQQAQKIPFHIAPVMRPSCHSYAYGQHVMVRLGQQQHSSVMAVVSSLWQPGGMCPIALQGPLCTSADHLQKQQQHERMTSQSAGRPPGQGSENPQRGVTTISSKAGTKLMLHKLHEGLYRVLCPLTGWFGSCSGSHRGWSWASGTSACL